MRSARQAVDTPCSPSTVGACIRRQPFQVDERLVWGAMVVTRSHADLAPLVAQLREALMPAPATGDVRQSTPAPVPCSGKAAGVGLERRVRVECLGRATEAAPRAGSQRTDNPIDVDNKYNKHPPQRLKL